MGVSHIVDGHQNGSKWKLTLASNIGDRISCNSEGLCVTVLPAPASGGNILHLDA